MNKEFYLNRAQQTAYIIYAVFAIHILGRGTGKTEGILAPKMIRMGIEMSRATFLIVAATFQQILTRTLPPLVASWQRMGYKLGEHILVGEKPTAAWKKKYKWEGPLRPPFDWTHVITLWNGTIFQMVSQDRIGSTNGMSVDGIFGDEAKLLNRERLFSETMPANRGAVKQYEGIPHHHGWTFTTDMPVGTSGRWLLDYKKEMDIEKLANLLEIECIIYDKKNELNGATGSKAVRIQGEIDMLRRYANEIRQDLVYFQTGSSLQNLAALGVKYIKNMMRELSDQEMKASILNMEPKKVEDCFYPDLIEEKHGYFAYDYGQFGKLGYNFQELIRNDDATVDKDYQPEEPLHIALDYNKRITPMVVGQVPDNEIRIINSFFSLYPEKLHDTLEKFVQYYRNHGDKTVFFWHDHTTMNEYSHTTTTQAEEVIDYLRSKGWNVIDMYIGRALGFERRYSMYSHLLQEDDTYPYVFRYNRERCQYLALSMFQTGTIIGKRGFEKDKRTELKEKFPAEESTHFGEAVDMMTTGILESGLSFISSGNCVGEIEMR